MMNEETEQSPFSRPGFIAAAIVVVLLVVLGVIVGVRGATRAPDAQAAAPVTVTKTPSPSTTSPGAPSPTSSGDSTCQPRPAVGGGDLASAPEAAWKFQGTIAYPTSPAVGPYVTTAAGRYCFEHSPSGALFMAANAAAQGSDPTSSEQWGKVALARGPYQATLRDKLTGSGAGDDGARLAIQGFRVLEYSPATARVDLGARVSTKGQVVNLSSVYELVWQDNDWKISTNVPTPIDVSTIPDLAGYTPWKG